MASTRSSYALLRKEVIQPHLPVRLPCSRDSPCRHGARTVSSSWSRVAIRVGSAVPLVGSLRRFFQELGAQVSEGSIHRMRASMDDFPADCPRHPMHFHGRQSQLVARDTCGFSSIQPSFSPTVASGGRNLLTTSPQSRTPPSTAPSLTGWATGFGCCPLSWCDGR